LIDACTEAGLTPALQEYVRSLKTTFEGKDPRSIAAPGSVLLSFPGDGMVTVTFERTTVRVLEGDRRDRELPSLLVRAHLLTWLQICTGEQELADADVELLGEPKLFACLARLSAAKRSGVASRFFQ
jgi:hypothetical protein